MTTTQTTDDSVVTYHCSNHHHYHQKQSHRRASLSETPLSSSVVSSASSSSSSSGSSSSTSSSSFSSSSSSVSSSSLSSESSSDCSDRYPPKKHQHSRSCTDISKHRYFEEGDEAAPLIDKSCCTKKECGKCMSALSCTTRGTMKNTKRERRGSGNNGRVRKAKSMEALTGPKERKLHGKEDEKEQERRKGEAMKNLMKEKTKFSAFLNEITRQVLSPMRLSTLGVTEAQRPCSPGQASVRSSKENSSREKLGQQQRAPANVNSSSSSKHSSRSLRHHQGHRSPDSTHHKCHERRNSTDENNAPFVTIIIIANNAKQVCTITDNTAVLSVVMETTAVQLITPM
ncbi:uncharacterized G-patch domain protein DDB_G0278987-like [Brachionichthys hirsutus]|uniref:uncharacterized G-patch domain protein DDB_G0278987-like n=1 Tax=Brachionichthys hirsutus TaxID=412623 RepID=UPI003604F41E